MDAEHDSWQMAEKEEENDAEQNGGQVHLGGPLRVALSRALVTHPNPTENVQVEVDEGGHGDQSGGDENGPVDVDADVVGIVAEFGRHNGDLVFQVLLRRQVAHFRPVHLHRSPLKLGLEIFGNVQRHGHNDHWNQVAEKEYSRCIKSKILNGASN